MIKNRVLRKLFSIFSFPPRSGKYSAYKATDAEQEALKCREGVEKIMARINKPDYEGGPYQVRMTDDSGVDIFNGPECFMKKVDAEELLDILKRNPLTDMHYELVCRQKGYANSKENDQTVKHRYEV